MSIDTEFMSEGEVPVQVGRYEILEIIGTGATGRVARAHDPMIGRQVAIKLFSKELAKGEARQRFLQEARVVGQLSHPSIMTLHEDARLLKEALTGFAL